MALLDKLARLANSPQGRKLVAKGKEALNDPKNQQRLQRLADKARGRDKPQY